MLKKIIFALFLVLTFGCSNKNEITIVENGKSNFVIAVSENATKWDSLAAKEIQKYIDKISGVILKIKNDKNALTSNLIVVGINNYSKNFDTTKIKDDGFILKTDKNNLIIAGNKEKGSLNGVYYFLEHYLGCRMYSTTARVIPNKKTISIPNIDIIENPAFSHREIHYFEHNNDDDYCKWHALVTSEDQKNTFGMFVHTFEQLVPAEKYFDKHPEYFALRDKYRMREQLCLSNPKVYEIVIQTLRKKIAENPNAKIWSVSQNDNYSFCQCENCKKIDDYEGSPSGSIIHFVNKIAKEFPEQTISTLAYQYSRKAPKHIKPEKNVNIMLCSIECLRTFPISADTSHSGFHNDLIEWGKISKNIYLWDYVVQFTNLVSPFPNFQVLQPNIKLFAENNVNMMFQQGAGHRFSSEFSELRRYIIAKLLWNPNINVDLIIDDFVNGYYGDAGKFIKEYITLMQNEVIKSGYEINIYGDPIIAVDSYLTPQLLDKYEKLFASAENAVSDKPEFLERVKIAKLPIIYTILEQAKVLEMGNRGLTILDDKNSNIINPKIEKYLDEFERISFPIKGINLNEKNLTPQTYAASYRRMLSKTMYNPNGLYKQVKFITEPNLKYPANGYKTLTNGKRGMESHYYNWLGFEGNNMEVIVDLEESKPISKVGADFIQTSFSWIFLPTTFEVSLSNDGTNFSNKKSVKNTTPITRKETASPEHGFIKNFSCTFDNVSARYLKVKATNMEVCPRWHPGFPYKAWIFTDEIIIE